MNLNIKNKGYTLIELLLVVGLLAISVGVTSDILLSIVRSYSKTQVMNELEQQANFVGLKIEKELRNAETAAIVNGGTWQGIRITPRGSTGQYVCYRVRNLGSTTSFIDRSASTNDATCASGTFVAVTSTGIGNVTTSCTLSGSNCFQVTSGTPTIVNIGIKFSQGQVTTTANFTGDVEITNTIVIRETY